MLFLLQLQKKTFTDLNGKKCLQKVSIKDSQNTFMIIANTAVELEERLKIRKNANNPTQPFMLIVQYQIHYKSWFILMNQNMYFFSIIKALDMCFKTYQVFNIECVGL